ncbi:MAG: glycosyltransferase family 2 protein [Solirubrobacteraceae bacterium]
MPVFVIPAYNEEANVPRLLADLESRPDLWRDGRVVLVDDGSTDGTIEAARAHDGDLPVEVLPLVRNQGPGRAFDRGFRRALALTAADGLIVTMESDSTSDLDALEGMLTVAREGADVVLASHHDGGALANVSRHRRFLSRAASAAIRRSGGLDASTVSSFFRVYRASVLQAGYERYGEDLIRERGFACKAEILMKLTRLGITVAEVPVVLDWSRREGESKMRVLPTMGGYARLMARQAVARARA